MLSIRLTNCVECANVPALLENIDCRLNYLASILYNNIIFELNYPVEFRDWILLLNYKRILTYRLCNADYAVKSGISLDKIASRVKMLTYGCIKPCIYEAIVAPTTTTSSTTIPATTTTTSTLLTTTTTSTTAIPVVLTHRGYCNFSSTLVTDACTQGCAGNQPIYTYESDGLVLGIGVKFYTINTAGVLSSPIPGSIGTVGKIAWLAGPVISGVMYDVSNNGAVVDFFNCP